MDWIPDPYVESNESKSAEVIVNDLQNRLEELRQKHNTIILEYCEILGQIEQVSSTTIKKHQEFNEIINNLEKLEFQSKNFDQKNIFLMEPGASVSKLREKFEKIINKNRNENIIEPQDSLKDFNKIQIQLNNEILTKTVHCPSEAEELPFNDANSDFCSTTQSFYSFSNNSSQNSLENLFKEKPYITRDSE